MFDKRLVYYAATLVVVAIMASTIALAQAQEDSAEGAARSSRTGDRCAQASARRRWAKKLEAR